MASNHLFFKVHLTISGTVQGVGFRSWAKWQAKKLGLVGWVKNRDDESVELVAEGTKRKLEELITRCRRGPEVSLVKNVNITWSDGTGELLGFEVIH